VAGCASRGLVAVAGWCRGVGGWQPDLPTAVRHDHGDGVGACDMMIDWLSPRRGAAVQSHWAVRGAERFSDGGAV
jgi:hypothetical protein